MLQCLNGLMVKLLNGKIVKWFKGLWFHGLMGKCLPLVSLLALPGANHGTSRGLALGNAKTLTRDNHETI